QALARRAAQLGPVDYLVPNAGIAELGDSLDMSAFDRQWAVNGAGALNTLGALRNELARPASVVFVGTFLTRSTFAGLAAYIASKAALVAQARTLAVEFAPLGVRINIVSPGPTATAIWGTLGLSDEQFEQVAEMVGKRLLPGHFLESAAVANVILFQLSQGARGVYGQDWVVDNGYTLNLSPAPEKAGASMLFKWKKTARQLRQERDDLQTTSDEQAARINALQEQLAAARASGQEAQRQLDYYRGVAGNLIRFSA